MYDGGGLELWREVYDRFNLVPFLCGNTGVQMTGWFKKPIENVEDLRGLKMRIPGLAGRVYQSVGVDVRLLPAGEIFPALERGVIDAAEFVGPYLDRQLGLQRAAKYYYTTGWHETATASELTINKAKWNSLPADLKAVIENACAACNVISEAWCQKNNAEAMEDLIKNQGVIAQPLSEPIVQALRKATAQVLDEAVAKDPLTKKVHDSYMSYMDKYTRWAGYSEAVYHGRILKT
jgi:TRAP-type mannitol/chloroaromatic compound transport system substrate-binding protein